MAKASRHFLLTPESGVHLEERWTQGVKGNVSTVVVDTTRWSLRSWECSCPEVRLMPIDEQRLGIYSEYSSRIARASSTAPTVPYYSLVILQEPRTFKEE